MEVQLPGPLFVRRLREEGHILNRKRLIQVWVGGSSKEEKEIPCRVCYSI